MSRPSTLLIPLTIAGMVLVTAGPIASAQEPPPADPSSISAEPPTTRAIEMTWRSSGVVPGTDQVASDVDEASSPGDDARGDSVAAEGHARVVGLATSADLDATASADANGEPIPMDDLISNYGCMMVEAEPGEHLGVNCIDDGWLNTDGTVYVHTTVPAAQQVRFSSDPPSGNTDDGVPEFTTFDLDSAPDYSSYEFTSKSFDILPAQTYHILAMAWDSEGNMAWRYGTATIPHMAEVVIDKITVLNDSDEYSVNKGEITFGISIDDKLVATFPEEKYDDGDSFDPEAEHLVEGSPQLVEVVVWAMEDDPGKCVVEAVVPDFDNYQDGGGCHFAQAVETFDLTTPQPSVEFDFTSPDEHLRIRVDGQITLSIP